MFYEVCEFNLLFVFVIKFGGKFKGRKVGVVRCVVVLFWLGVNFCFSNMGVRLLKWNIGGKK